MTEQRNALEEAILIATESGKEMADEFKTLQEKLEFANRLNKQLNSQLEHAKSANERARSLKSVGKALLSGVLFGICIGFTISK